MKSWHVSLLVGVGLTACSPHQFGIVSDEPIQDVEVELSNVRKVETERVTNTHTSIDVWVGDSSGKIIVKLAGGRNVTCKVGYITPGDVEPHAFIVSDGACLEGFQE